MDELVAHIIQESHLKELSQIRVEVFQVNYEIISKGQFHLVKMGRRKFSFRVEKQALIRAHHRCQICGDFNDLKCCYIHPRKLKYVRTGITPEKWYNSIYVRSLDNCVVLCYYCTEYVNSKGGLHDVPVSYLESLNSQHKQCTAMIYHQDNFIRCRYRQADEQSYRCLKHLEVYSWPTMEKF